VKHATAVPVISETQANRKSAPKYLLPKRLSLSIGQGLHLNCQSLYALPISPSHQGDRQIALQR
jgi:hypothetical protein